MKIGVLGAGNMSRALARKWLRSGHEVLIAGRSPDKAEALAAELGEGASSGSFADAVAYADTLLVAIMAPGVMDALEAAGADDGALAGKTILDCCNPVDIETFRTYGNETSSLAERIQSKAAGASVVKAFNLCQVAVWEMDPVEFDGRTLVVPCCGDSEAAVAAGEQLIRDAGCEPMNLGPLYFSRSLEEMAAIVISRLLKGAPPTSVFNWISPAPAG